MKNIILQIRYPYTALIIAVIWLGAGSLAAMRSDLPAEAVLLLLSIATVIISMVGFTAPKR
jgi:hypothetical protein